MQNYFYLITIPIAIIIIYVIGKVAYLKLFKRKTILEAKAAVSDEIEEGIEDATEFVHDSFIKVEQVSIDGFQEIKDYLFKFIEIIKNTFTTITHFLLHFVVLFLKFIKDFTDKVYAKARNSFLHTATKEKSSVTIFWNHLKEYKKEVEEDWKKNRRVKM